jgi:hypothetical protein
MPRRQTAPGEPGGYKTTTVRLRKEFPPYCSQATHSRFPRVPENWGVRSHLQGAKLGICRFFEVGGCVGLVARLALWCKDPPEERVISVASPAQDIVGHFPRVPFWEQVWPLPQYKTHNIGSQHCPPWSYCKVNSQHCDTPSQMSKCMSKRETYCGLIDRACCPFLSRPSYRTRCFELWQQCLQE